MQRTVHAVVAAILLSGTGGSAAFAAQSGEPYWPTSAPGAEVRADPAAPAAHDTDPGDSAGSSTSPAKPAEDGGLGLAALGAAAVIALAGTGAGVVVHRRVRAPKLG